MAAGRCWSGFRSVRFWDVELVSGVWLYMDIGLSLGMDTVPLRRLELFRWFRLGMETRGVLWVGNGLALPPSAAWIHAARETGWTTNRDSTETSDTPTRVGASRCTCEKSRPAGSQDGAGHT